MTESTLPRVLASGPALHLRARVELTNGAVLVGHITEMDADTMNLTMDGFTQTAVRRGVKVGAKSDQEEHGGNSTSGHELASAAGQDKYVRIEEPDPVALRCMRSVVVRGACIRYLDLAPDDDDGDGGAASDGGDLADLLEAVKEAIPSV